MSLATLIDELNPQQKQAATTETKHSLVLAGAGCGKTKTICFAKKKNCETNGFSFFMFSYLWRQ